MFQLLSAAMQSKSLCTIDGDGEACEKVDLSLLSQEAVVEQRVGRCAAFQIDEVLSWQLDHIIGFPNPPTIIKLPLTSKCVASNERNLGTARFTRLG